MRKLRKLLQRLLGTKSTRRVSAFSPSVSSTRATPRRVRRRGQKTVGTRLATAASTAGRTSLGLLPYVVVAVAVASLPVFGYKLYLELMTSPHLALSKIEVTGTERVTRETILATAGLELGENLLNVEENAVAERVLWHPWVAKVKVERELPDTITIAVEERKPAAILVSDQSYLVDEDGHVFKALDAGEYAPELLVIAGLDANRMMKMGEERRLRETLNEILAVTRDYETMGLDRFYNIVEVTHDEILGFTLVTPDRVRFVLGFGDYTEKLRRLASILTHLERNGSGVEVVRLDNEREPWKVAVAGTEIEFKHRRAVQAVPAIGRAMLP